MCVRFAPYSRLVTDTAHLNDVVIVHDQSSGEVYEFSTYVEQPDGSLLVGDHLEARASFHRVDGERLSASLTPYGTVERLLPTGERDLATVRTLLADYARQQHISWDGDDPQELLLAVRRREYAARWPKWPGWLDRWMHGPGPH